MDRADVITETENAPAALVAPVLSAPAPSLSQPLLGVVLALAVPALVEQIFNFLVGLNDTWLANNLPKDIAPSATAAVGTISYLLWFIGLIVSSVGTGATALISRAKGARHKRLANNVCGQSVAAGLVLGTAMGLATYVFARPLIGYTLLSSQAAAFALS